MAEDSATDLTPSQGAPEHQGRKQDTRAWWKVRVAFAAMLAFMVPAPRGYWPPESIILWSLIGDPQSAAECVGGLVLGTVWLGAYGVAFYALITLGVRLIGRARRGSAMQ